VNCLLYALVYALVSHTPSPSIPHTAGNTTAGIWLTSHMNSAKFRSNGTHAEEEKAREIKLQEEIDEAKRISLGDSGGNCE